MHALLRRLVLPGITCLAMVLSGCQSLKDPMPGSIGTEQGDQDALESRIHQREAVLAARNTFEVDGGLGIWTDSETIAARLDWRQSPDGLDLTLAGPLGMGTLHLHDDGSFVTLSRGDQVIAQGKNADSVLQQGLGLAAPVPIGELGFWIKGLPGNATSVVHDESGKLSTLRYIDKEGTHWQARFRRYTMWDGMEVPSLVTASGGPYSVRLRLKDWQYSATTTVPARPESNNRLPIPGR